MRPPQPTSTLFPYTTLFRSHQGHGLRDVVQYAQIARDRAPVALGGRVTQVGVSVDIEVPVVIAAPKREAPASDVGLLEDVYRGVGGLGVGLEIGRAHV